MGLGFTIHTKIKDIEKFQQAVESQAVESGYNAEHDESSSTVSFCRLGDLFLNYQHEGEGNADNVISVNGDCQTNMLGPGFHKAAIGFIDRLQQATGTRFEVEDETDYYTERDFEAMKKKHFHKWLAKLFEIIQEQEDKGSTSLSICWDLNKYYPQSDSGIVISPLGSFRLSEVIRRIREEGIESFADDFFIWNNPERDARFHRGLALNAMWEDCYFMPSERSEEDARINGYIISELETAASLDPSLPFPKKEYEELCRLHGCTPVPTDGIPTYETEFAIGYRRGIVNHKVGRIRFSLPGSYLEDTDDGTLVYYDAAADNWHTVRCTGYSTNGDPDFLDVEEEMIEEREFDGGKYRLYDMGTDQDSEDEEPYPVYSCHALCSNQYTLFTLCASRLEDLKKLSSEFLPTLVADQPIEPENKQIIYTGENMNDELMKQIDEWHKAEKHQEIIDALEQIPEAERDFETTSLLARAYNNIEEYAKAAELLESVKEEGAEDERWNFRMGYAQYFLNNYREALGYFSKVRELDPEDEDALSLIRQCNMAMPLTRRVKEFWNWFVENEEKLSGMMNPKSMEEADAFVEFINEGSNLISKDMHFNIGGDHEFTFSVEGWPDLFIIYPYIISCMPECLKGKWKFFPFNPGKVGSFDFKMHGVKVNLDKVMVKPSYDEKRGYFNIRYYDRNLCSLPLEKSHGAAHIILELTLGEGVSFKYINEIERVSGIEDGMISLSGLRQHIEETVKSHGHDFFENPRDVYSQYQFTPKEDGGLRSDVIICSTCMDSIVADYCNDSTEIFDHANGFGAQAVFIVFRNGNYDDSRSIVDFRHDLEDRITEEILEPDNLGFAIGGAAGTNYSYIDLIVYDFISFVDKVKSILKEYPDYSFYISDFIRNGHILQLTEADSDVIPYTKENAEAFFKQIEDWNDNDRYTKCIRALETIPADEMDYESTMLLVRAYENYAILGDNNEEPEIKECDRALNKALELLESVRETGENKARWNMRMAYAYQYLTGQKEKAVAYAEKWAELDPEDNNAKVVIKVCMEEISKREDSSNVKESYTVEPCDTGNTHIETRKTENTELRDKNMDNRQKEAALAAMTAWLSHAQELGHKPAEIECTGTFVLHDMTYYIFKYKDTKDSEWLLGVNGGYEGDSLSDCGHTFSEMEPYNEKTAVKDATALVEMVRSYWMEQAKQAEEREKKAGTFVGFALLSDNSWDKEKYIRDLKEQWDITAEEKSDEERNPESLVFDVGDMMAAVSLMPAPVPNGEAEECAKNNYMWPEAEKTAKEHKAHIMVAVIGKEKSLIERGKLYVKLLSVCCHQKNITGIYTSGVVSQPRFYEGFSGMMKEDSLPIYNWIWFGLYRTEKGISGYTYGMECFGKDEMEVLDVDADPSKVRDFLASMAGYVLEYDVVLNDGETIGFSAADKHRITRGQGVALPDKVTLKISYGSEDDADGGPDFPDDTDEVMDDAEGHLEKFKEKDLPLDTITAYNHLAIYLRWCMVNDLMRDDFLERFGDLVSRIKSGSADDDLRVFIKDNLNGKLTRFLFNKQGRAFADYYYGSYYGANETPFYPGDIDNHALDYFGPERYHSDEFKEEAYLFVPYDEDYYQAMSQRIDRRFANWQGLHIDKDTVEPDELARAFMDYLDCECTYFPSMSDDDPIMSAYTYAQRLGVREGFIPVLVNVDEGLWENIIGNSDPDSESSDDYTFNREKVNEFRRRLLEAPVMDGKSILDKLTGQDNDDIDEEPEGGFDNNRYSSYWNTDTNMTHPLILARIPVTEPWKIFAYLPFGNWNDCPANPELMAISKYWYEEYGAVPGTFTSDQLEYELPAPVPEDKAMEAAIQQYAFCPDMDQNCNGIGSLADTLRQSRIWYFWWD